MNQYRKTSLAMGITFLVLLLSAQLIPESFALPEAARILPVRDQTTAIGYSIVIFLLLGLLAGLAITLFLERRVVARLKALNRRVNRIRSKGDPGERIYVKGKDELARLTMSINAMLEGIEGSHLKLQESADLFRTLVESMDDIVFTLDRNQRFTSIFGRWPGNEGILPEFFVGKTVEEVLGEEANLHVLGIQRAMTGEHVVYEWWVETTKETLYYQLSLSPLKAVKGAVNGVVGVIRDITVQVRMREALKAMSLVDGLTGISNRRGFLVLANQQQKMVQRMGKGLFLIFADLDNFKSINDTLGHQEGDFALIETSKILKESFRESDIIGRMGGDEFAVIGPESETDGGSEAVKRLEKNIEAWNGKNDRPYKLSLSMGISRCAVGETCPIQEMIDKADALMYEQKQAKKKKSSTA